MKSFGTVTLILLAVVIVVGSTYSCGGGNGNGGTVPELSLADLEGSWLGPAPLVGTTTYIMNGSGQITDILNGGSSSGVTGSVYQLGNNHFHYILHGPGSPTGEIFVDRMAEHCFMNPETYPLTLEKGAAAIPTYFEEEILGSWSGFGYSYSVTLNEFVLLSPITITITDNVLFYALSGTAAGESVLGTVFLYVSDYGIYSFDFSLEPSIYSGYGALSPDKSFMGISTLMDPGGIYPDDSIVFLLNRN
jgi:hypothetical protein